MRRMKIKASTVAMTLALAALPHAVNAAGLGKITVLSVLGQPLRAEVDISASREELTSLSGRIAPNESFRQAGIEYVSALSDVRVSVAKRTDGRPYLLLKSNRAINEAFIDLLLELNWDGGRLQREYTFLLDPPELLQPSPAQPVPHTPTLSQPAVASTSSPTTPASSSNEPSAKPSSSAVASSSKVSPPSQPTPTPLASSEEKTASGMKVIRDDSGVLRIVKAEKPAAPPQKDQEATRQAYQVKHGDTLSKIAKSNLPEGTNLDQMLVALFRSNKDAFEGGNINRLKTGRILALPDQAAIDSVDPQEARRIIVAQSADFNAYRKKLAAATEAAPAAPAQEEAPQQTSKGKIEPRLQEPAAPPASTKDKLEISKSAASKDTHEKDLAARAAAIEEDIIAREKSLKEANSRIAELDKSLADMKKLLELKNKSLADTQNQTAEAPLTSAKPAEKLPTPDASTEQPAEKPADSAEKPTTPASSQEQPAAAPHPAPAPAHEAAPVQTPTPPPSSPSSPSPSPSPESSPSFIDENPDVLYGGGGILALLLGYMGFKAWRKRKDAQESQSFQDDDLSLPSSSSPHSQTESSVSSVFGNTGGQVVDTRGAEASIAPASIDIDYSLASAGTPDANEKVDPIAEADVYMAYGRTEQAEEILLDALKNDPTRYALHLKLLDIYATRKAVKPFENIARELHTQTDGNGAEWEQAAQLGRTIDPGNTLYAEKTTIDLPTSTPTPQEPRPYDPTATMVMTPRDIDKIATTTAPLETNISEEVPESLDFELDLGGDSIQTDAPDTSASDFDLNLNHPEPVFAAPDAQDTQEVSPPAEAASLQTSDDIIDFELDFPALEEAPQNPILAPDATPTTESSIELPSIQDSTSPLSPAEPSEQPIIPDTIKPSSDDNDLEFDLGDPSDSPLGMTSADASDVIPSKAPRIDLSAISLDLDDTTTLSLPPSHTQQTPAAEKTSGDEPTLKLETPPALEMPELEIPALENEPATPTEDDTPGSTEVDTKLELANAYEEMGDHEGARELLQEVLNEGNARQKAVAQGKLSQLG